ncbi:MAG: 4'-phosphopantetheinyl transferase family protein [Limimaricola soesokkakensis]|uniref:4'-phosphopantetheinyl transferase family protein n=1 Tax=Limimaricola soesokkakensis TaxID=1343159 RepID=UPI00405921B3
MVELAALIERLGGTGTAAAVVRIGAGHALWPEEVPAMARARPARQAEFAAGRAAARLAMERLDLPPRAVPMGPDRAPVWPQGMHGSISHDDGLAVAALCREGDLGLDLSAALPLEPALWPEIALPDEIEATGLEPGLAARLVFGAKEAAYKAQYPRSRALLGFEAMRVQVTGEGLAARLLRTAGPYGAGTVFHGGWGICSDRLIVVMRAPPGFRGLQQ